MTIKSMFPPVPPLTPTNVHNFLFRRPDQPFANYTLHIDAVTGKKRSSHEFLERAYDGATALASPPSEGGLGLEPETGEMVGILSPNCMDYIALVHSLLILTTPFALLSSYSTPFELKHAIRLSKATRIFVDPKLLPLALQCAQECGLSSDRIYILEGHVKGRKSYGEMIDKVRKRGAPRVPVRSAGKDTIAYLIFSSGTSGLPKAVMISHGNLCFALAQYVVVTKSVLDVYTPPTPKTPEGIPVVLAFLPFYHTFGLHMFAFRGFVAPATAVILPRWNAEFAVKIIPKYRISHFLLVPSVVQPLLDASRSKNFDLSSLLGLGSGAAYLPPQLAEELSQITPGGVEVTEGYGMSETTVAATVKPRPELFGGRVKPQPGTAGVLLPGLEARIVREDGSDADTNEPGELHLRGGNIVLGYWDNEKATRETFVDGWLKTGDRFRVNEDGLFFFEDRVKDTLKVSGMQVSPTEIEGVLLHQPDKLILDVAVAGVNGGRTSDEKVPRAWIVLSKYGRKRGKDAVFKTLEAWSQEHLSKYKWLRGGFEVVREIPKSPTGKVLRRELQDRYEKRHPRAKL
ncbi:hypothetical protein JAAARDRAFT_30700 [Jaapia argillacea MUCL 33604]|uniref:AMP-dependent synthetase/ligase domain-containing protein n=1 Tax=Jaapia argillacea MUCL 33604 TaxID=933084 RepID=A0A067QGZ5_9AGAM|nr:hypothetical protein JAAARDRAFT_30700 [Jaapia argillacea MUCL 33604]